MSSFHDLKKINNTTWELPKTGDMNVPARFIASEKIVRAMDQQVYDQISNVASMPGIQRYAFAMADSHSGYGVPVGGVAAFDVKNNGVISPGAIGFDINCGMRLVKTNLTYKEIKPKLKEVIDYLFKTVPVGVGASGIVKLNANQFKEVMVDGAKWCVENGYGWKEDIDRIEDFGAIPNANPSMVSQKALDRGRDQLGTLGSGNHYLEIQTCEKPDDEKLAEQFGLEKDQVVIMLHCGSRGFGHQICSDYVKVFQNAMQRYNISVKDPELSCAPFSSPEGEDYFSAMNCAANMAFANRQVIMHRIREAFSKVFKKDAEKLGMELIYDVAHNIAKVEEYKSGSKNKKYIVHRKGATRSFGPGRKEIAPLYRKIGQPVIIGGSMETGSYLLVGTKKAEDETFGSTAHGSGRLMSRTQAKREFNGEKLQQDMEKRGIYIRTASYSGLAEEAGGAYKNISDVIQSISDAGISKPVCALKPIGNLKG